MKTPEGPCMCGATDCPSCGHAQGYRPRDEEIIKQCISRMRADPHTVGEALTDLTADEYAITDRLVFEAIDGERTDGFQPEQLQAIGRHLVDSVIHQFDRIARKE